MPSRAAEQQRQFVQYHQRVLATNPIAYWPLDERSGTVAYGWAVRPAGTQNGTHVGVTLGQPGIGDGRTAPYYDGINDDTDIFSAAFAAAFNGSVGTAMMWIKVTAAIWADGTNRYNLDIRNNASNQLYLLKSSAANRLSYTYVAGGVAEAVNADGVTSVDWIQMAMTWNVSAGVDGEVRCYLNGAQTGATQTSLGVWAGAPVNGATVIGDRFTTHTDPWQGHIAHCAIWNRALTANELLALYTARWA